MALGGRTKWLAAGLGLLALGAGALAWLSTRVAADAPLLQTRASSPPAEASPTAAWGAPASDAGPGPSETMFPSDGALVVIVTRARVPVANAAVRIYLDPHRGFEFSDWRLAGAATTTKDGQVRLMARAGLYLVSVRSEGTHALDVAVREPGSLESTARIELLGPVSVRGRIIEKETRTPVPDADVSVVMGGEALARLPPEETQHTHSDARGRFELSGLGAREALIVATANGYVPNGASLSLDAKLSELELPLARLSSVSGVVRDLKNAPVAGATVTADGPGRLVTALSSADGRFSIGCNPGDYWLGAEKDGAASALRHLTLVVDRAADPVELVLRPAARVEGVVVERPSGDPVGGANVQLQFGDNFDVSRHYAAVADEAGRFQFAQLPSGSYDVIVRSAAQCSATKLSLEAGKREELRLELDAAGWLDGTVVDPLGAAVARAIVTLSSGSSSPLCFPDDEPDTRTDEEGRFHFGQARPGKAAVEARHPDLAGGQRERVVVEPGVGATVRIVLSGSGILRGEVRKKGGGPAPPEVRVTIEDQRGTGRSSPVGSDGKYSSRLAAGQYTVEASYPHARHFIRDLPRVTVESGKETIVDLEVADDPARVITVHGQVLDPEGSPTRAWLNYANGHAQDTNLDGTFDVSGTVEEGAKGIEVRASANGTSSDNALVTESTTHLVLKLRALRRVEGRVRDPSGRKVERFSLEVKSRDLTSHGWNSARPFEGDTFSFDLEPDALDLRADLPDGRSGQVFVPVSDTPARVELLVSAPGAVRVRAVDSRTHKPVKGAHERAWSAFRTSEPVETETGPDGVATLALTAGDWTLSVTRPDWDDAVDQPIHVAGAGVIDLGDVALEGGLESGKVGVAYQEHADGVEVTEVIPGSGAEAAGLLAGDVILNADGHPIKHERDAKAWLGGEAGTSVAVTFRRGTDTRTVSISRSP